MPIVDRLEFLDKIHMTFRVDYPIIYDKIKDTWRCTCSAATFQKNCKHIQQAKKHEEDIKEMFI